MRRRKYVGCAYVAMLRANKARFHLHDGVAQRARDADWAKAGDRSPDTLRWLYEFDPAAVAAI